MYLVRFLIILAFLGAGIFGSCSSYQYSHKDPTMSHYEGDMVKAVVNGDRRTLATLVDRGCTVNFQSADGTSLLMRAVFRDNCDMVDDLLRYGADPNLADGTGLSSLMVASDGGHSSIVTKLLKAGAKVDQSDNNGTTALSYATKPGPFQAEIIRILIDKGANVNKHDGGINKAPPLFRAFAANAFDLADILLRHGADIKARDGYGNSIDHYLTDVGKVWLSNHK